VAHGSCISYAVTSWEYAKRGVKVTGNGAWIGLTAAIIIGFPLLKVICHVFVYAFSKVKVLVTI